MGAKTNLNVISSVAKPVDRSTVAKTLPVARADGSQREDSDEKQPFARRTPGESPSHESIQATTSLAAIDHPDATTDSAAGPTPQTSELYAQAGSTEPAAGLSGTTAGTSATTTASTSATSATTATGASAATTAAATAGFSGTTMAVVGGAVGLGAAAGGGGGGKSSADSSGNTPAPAVTAAGPTAPTPNPPGPPASDPVAVPQPPAAPSIDAVSADNLVNGVERAAGVSVSGSGVAGTVASITWGTITKSANVDVNGRWTVLFAPGEVPASQGSSTVFASVTQAGLTSAIAQRSVAIDTIPLAPTIQAVAGDDRVDSVELIPGITVAGLGQAGATIAVDWSGTSKTATANNLGQWSVTFSAAEVPTAQGSSSIEAKASSFGLSSTTSKRTVTIDSLPLAPTIDAISSDDRISASELAAGISVNGTSQANASVTVTWGTTDKVVTANSTGNWTTTFLAGEIPAGDGNSSVSASVTSSKLTGPSASHTVLIDTAAPSTPTASIDAKGIVSGTAEAGATITIDSNGDNTADASTVVGSNGTYVFSTSFTGGQTLNIQALDSAGNKSGSVSKVAPNSTYGAAGADIMAGNSGDDLLIAGGGADTVTGGAGNDQLIGGSSANIRNYQFEYWDLRGANAAGLWDNGGGGYYAIINATSAYPEMAGWKLGNWMDIQSREFGQGASKVVQWVGVPDLQSTPTIDEHIPPVMEFRSPSASTAADITDTAPGSGRYLFDTVYAPLQGGSNIHQTIQTNPNETYTLTMRVSDPSLSNNSMVVTWNGAELAVYDAIADTWSGAAPIVTTAGTNYVNLSWSVAPNSAGAATALDIKVYGTLEDNPANWRSMRIERITLDAGNADGNDLLIGDSGNDRLFGQAGDDTLVGGGFDSATQTATPDGYWDQFIYSMRSNSGNDVIKDFEVGIDGLILTDLVDSHLGAGLWDSITNPAASRTLDGLVSSGAGYVQPPGTTNVADNNLSFHDLMPADSPHQYLQLSSDGTAANNLRISLFGVNGVSQGSIVLEGVQFGSGAGQYDTVQDLLGDGYTDPTVPTPGGSPAQILWLTMDGYHANLLV